MRVLVACEFSGIVREAFTRRGHDAWSCDLLPSEQPGNHIQGDMRLLDYTDWDLLIAHPDCTYLASSGARWWKERQKEQREAIELIKWIMSLPVPRIALENPIGILSTAYRKPDQIIQPWWFGEGETKATCLWLKNLPPLMATLVHPSRYPRVHLEPPNPKRKKNRSRTYRGLAEAMATQWGSLPIMNQEHQ